MGVMARDVMSVRFHTLSAETPLGEAVRKFKKASEEQREKVFGMMVVDDHERLVGMVSMYDILLLMRPKHIHIWGEMDDIDVEGYVENSCRRMKPMLVGDIMSSEVVTITPDTHLLMVVDIMLRKHIRRLPVLDDGKVVGIVYLSRVFYHLVEYLAAEPDPSS